MYKWIPLGFLNVVHENVYIHELFNISSLEKKKEWRRRVICLLLEKHLLNTLVNDKYLLHMRMKHIYRIAICIRKNNDNSFLSGA